MIVVVGSHALVHRCNLLGRKPNDIDIVGTYDDVVGFVKEVIGKPKVFIPTDGGKKIVAKSEDGLVVEAEVAWPASNAEELMQLIAQDPNTVTAPSWAPTPHSEYRGTVAFPSLNVLYTLKMSHRFLKNSPHFNKTLDDCKYLASKSAFIQPEHFEFFKRREAATYNYKHPSLNVAKTDFFTGDGVKYVYDHDSIHEAMKHLERPAYTYFKPPQNEVMCSREMFDLLPQQIKLYAVLEEAYVLAIERSQVPFPETDPKHSFLLALEKVCTSITSGWFREFAWSNYDWVLMQYDALYMQRFRAGITQGIVTPYDPSKQY